MRFTYSLDELATLRPLIDLVEERLARQAGQTLQQYRAAKAAQPINAPRKTP